MSSLRFLTAGESHGQGLTVIVEGIPAGLCISATYIDKILSRRQKGFGSGGRMKIESDKVKILSGVRHGVSLGSPIALWIENKDFVNWQDAMSVEPVPAGTDTKKFTRVVPGHADFAGALKYVQHDLRNVLERASARETAARVAAGAIAMLFLQEFGITVHSHVLSIGKVIAKRQDVTQIRWEDVENSQLRTADTQAQKQFADEILNAKRSKTTVGGTIQVVAFSPPVGLGSHVHWDRKLDGKIAQSMMSINAVKGVEIGYGFENTKLPGRNVQDILVADNEVRARFRKITNHAGGIEGGMSNGNPIVVNIAVKPIATMAEPLPSVDINTGEAVPAAYNRSDVCQVPRACPIAEAALALTLTDCFIEKFGGDSITEVKHNFNAYIESHTEFGIQSE